MRAFDHDIECVCIKTEAQITSKPMLSHFPHPSLCFRLYYKKSEMKEVKVLLRNNTWALSEIPDCIDGRAGARENNGGLETFGVSCQLVTRCYAT